MGWPLTVPMALLRAACARANKRIIAFSCALCLMALSNALYIPVQLEDLILNHPDAAVMQVAGRLPEWHDAKGLMHIQQGLQDGSVHLGKSFVIEQAAAAAAAAARQQAASALHTLGGSNNNNAGSFALGIPSIANTTVGAAPVKSNAAAHAVPALYGVEAGPWRNNGSWVAGAVAGMVQRVVLYKSEPWQCPDVERLRRNLLKHHEEIVRMQVRPAASALPAMHVQLSPAGFCTWARTRHHSWAFAACSVCVSRSTMAMQRGQAIFYATPQHQSAIQLSVALSCCRDCCCCVALLCLARRVQRTVPPSRWWRLHWR